MTLDDLIRLMFRAAHTEHGLLLRVSDPARALRAFARAREDHASDPSLPDGSTLPPVRFRELSGHPEGNLVILPGHKPNGASRPDPAPEGDDIW